MGADLHAFAHHWQDEADAAYLYRLLADVRFGYHEEDIRLTKALT